MNLVLVLASSARRTWLHDIGKCILVSMMGNTFFALIIMWGWIFQSTDNIQWQGLPEPQHPFAPRLCPNELSFHETNTYELNHVVIALIIPMQKKGSVKKYSFLFKVNQRHIIVDTNTEVELKLRDNTTIDDWLIWYLCSKQESNNILHNVTIF